MNAAVAFLQSFGAARLGAMGIVAAGLVLFFGYLIFQFNATTMVPLYSGLSLDDSIAMTKVLDTAQIKYQLKSDASAIFVSQDDVLKTRMKLAETGLPSGGAIGYEIFDKQDALGTTSFVQNVNQLRALEGELARTIRTIDKVSSVRVHLVLPERQLFRQDQQEPTASIVIKTKGQLEGPQIRAIQHLVASAVPGLKPNRVAIIDEFGRLLASGADEANGAQDSASVEERNSAYQERLRNQIQQIVENVVGPGKAKVQVTAEMDYSRVTQTADTFDPSGQVVRSTQTKQENSQTQSGENQVTVGNQVPNPQNNANTGAAPKDASNTTEEIVNYEISRTTRTEVQEGGRVKRLSVAVLVDGRFAPDAKGKAVYTPRQQQELDQISTLVRSAMGFDKGRGDQLDVVNLQFADLPTDGTGDVKPGLFDFTKDDIMKMVEWGVMALLTILVLLFVARPLIRQAIGPSEPMDALENGPSAPQTTVNPDGTTTVVIPAPNGGTTTVVLDTDGKTLSQQVVSADGQPIVAGPPDRITEAQIQGEVQMDQIRRVGELVEQNPMEAALAIRMWLN